MKGVTVPSEIAIKTLLSSLVLSATLVSSLAATTINSTNKYAYGANLGWMDWRGDTNSGAVIGEYVCSGYIYAANAGWINLGAGAPTNGIQYQNLAANDFGVNQDGLGNLRGYAYGANIGWINFENTGAPKMDLKTGRFTGFIYSANCGWISLSNASAFMQTDAFAPGLDSDANGLPDAWELKNFSHLGVNPNADADGDGMSNKQEYLAGTNPNDASDKLAIILYHTTAGGTSADLTWKSVPTRCYYIQKSLDFNTPTWLDSGLGLISPDGATTFRALTDTTAPNRFFRIQAARPLTP
jgi:hypothetical protein